MNIRQLKNRELAPMELLLLADPSRTIVEEYIQRGKCYVAEEEEEVVGVFVLLATRPKTVELVNIAVKETMQGNGLGKQLIQWAIQEAEKNGYQRIEVGTGNSSIGQLALYQKCGFRIVGVDLDFFVHHYSEVIIENGIRCRDMIRLSRDL